MYKAFKFKLIPNKTQQILINKNLGCCRFLYNQMLEERQNKYKSKDKSKNKTEKQYKTEFEFLKEVDSSALQQSRVDLSYAYSNFFRNIKKKQKTSLKFKSRKNPKNSYRTVNNNNMRIKDNYIRIPKIGFVKFKKSREISGIIKSITVSRNILNKYYISILCDTEIEKLPEIDKNIGIDLGIKSFCFISDNTKIKNPKYLKKSELKLARIQRSFSRKKKSSNRREKCRKKLFKIHQKIANQRLDFLHQRSSEIINENQVICLEDLSVKNMVKNNKLAKSISDCSWSKFVEFLEYKANWYGRTIIKIDKFFPSSKLCSNCGNKKEDLKLEDRIYNCSFCGISINRDYNASLNILKEGLRILNKNRRDDEVISVNNKTLVLCS